MEAEFCRALKDAEPADEEGLSHYFAPHPQVQAQAPIDNIIRLTAQMGIKSGASKPLEKKV